VQIAGNPLLEKLGDEHVSVILGTFQHRTALVLLSPQCLVPSPRSADSRLDWTELDVGRSSGRPSAFRQIDCLQCLGRRRRGGFRHERPGDLLYERDPSRERIPQPHPLQVSAVLTDKLLSKPVPSLFQALFPSVAR
jgi:hypothetical protein